MTLRATLATSALLTAMLAACGGGSDEGVIVEIEDPVPSGLPSQLAVAGAATASFNGTYNTDDTRLNNVTLQNPPGDSRPPRCQFAFGPIDQTTGGSNLLTGEVEYLQDSNQVSEAGVGIGATVAGNTIYTLESGTATVDRPNDRIVFTNAVFTNSAQPSRPITVNGFVSMRGERPGDC